MLLSIVMQIREFLELVAQLPGWLLYFGAPALLVLAGIVLVLVRAERAYPPVALLLGAVGLVLVAGIAESSSDFVVWAALYAADRCGWRVLSCCDGEQPLPIDRIADMIWEEARTFLE